MLVCRNMDMVKAPSAQAAGYRGAGVRVGVLDTGVDYTHPDLAHQIDYSRSVSCVGGVANASREAWRDTDGHGTW